MGANEGAAKVPPGHITVTLVHPAHGAGRLSIRAGSIAAAPGSVDIGFTDLKRLKAGPDGDLAMSGDNNRLDLATDGPGDGGKQRDIFAVGQDELAADGDDDAI